MIDDNEAVRALAHEIWEREGRPEGHALEHWQRAEAELLRQGPGEPPPRAMGLAEDPEPWDAGPTDAADQDPAKAVAALVACLPTWPGPGAVEY